MSEIISIDADEYQIVPHPLSAYDQRVSMIINCELSDFRLFEKRSFDVFGRSVELTCIKITSTEPTELFALPYMAYFST